jgi:AsmA protein
MRKHTLLVLSGAAVLLAAIVVLAVMAADLNRNKPRLERAASQALGMNVRIGGRVSLDLLPRVQLALADGRVEGAKGDTVLAVRRAHVGISWLPLLSGKLRFNRVELREPRLNIERDIDGHLNFGGTRNGAALLGAIAGSRFSVSGGTIRYTDRRTGDGVEANGVELAVTRLQVSRGDRARLWTVADLAADIRCETIRSKRLRASAVRATVTGSDGRFVFTPITLQLFGGQAKGSLRADVSGPVQTYQLDGRLSRFRAEELLVLFSPEAVADGVMDLTGRLSLRGGTRDELVRTVTGDLSLRGADLTLTGNDLDRALSRFKSGSSFNLTDVGGLFLAGPLSLVVTRGYNFAGLFKGPGGTTTVRTLVCDWHVERGVAEAKDVALATKKNRVALAGRLDFVHERFDDVTVAAVDDHGCAQVRQVIHGPFRDPKVEKPHFLGTLAGPVLNMFGRIRRALPGTDCPVFYAGSVAAPD